MKFKIRFADQIVGVFVIIAVLSLGFVTVMLVRAHRWFANDIAFYTTLQSASGLSRNMAIQYRGFTIGQVRNFVLTEDDDVRVDFLIFEEYSSRARLGSVVDINISPIGLGNQFIFHPGRGVALTEGDFIPIMGSEAAMELFRMGLAVEQQQDDGIALIMNRVAGVLYEAQTMLAQVNEAFGPGAEQTEIGMIASSIRRMVGSAEVLPQSLDGTIQSVNVMLDSINEDLSPILANINTLTGDLAGPDGLLFSVLAEDGEIHGSLVDSLSAVASILESLDRVVAFVPAQLPQVAGIIMDLSGTMRAAEDVLIALTHNPLLRRGVPDRPETDSGGASPRNIRF